MFKLYNGNDTGKARKHDTIFTVVAHANSFLRSWARSKGNCTFISHDETIMIIYNGSRGQKRVVLWSERDVGIIWCREVANMHVVFYVSFLFVLCIKWIALHYQKTPNRISVSLALLKSVMLLCVQVDDGNGMLKILKKIHVWYHDDIMYINFLHPFHLFSMI